MKTIDEIRQRVAEQKDIVVKSKAVYGDERHVLEQKAMRIGEYNMAVILLNEIDRLSQTLRAIEIIIEERK